MFENDLLTFETIKDIPRTFENAVARDCWAMQNLDVPLLPVSAHDRLTEMPNDETIAPFGPDWAQYAIKMAAELENSRHWLEAQAYWFAAAQILTQANEQTSEDFAKAITGIVRTGGRSAGMPISENDHDFVDLVEIGLANLSAPLHTAIIRSLLIVGTLKDTIYEDAGFSKQTRIVLLQTLSEGQRSKGSHDIFIESARVYTKEVSELCTLIDTLIVNLTLENSKNQRNKLLERLARLPNFVLEQDKPLINKVHSLLSTKLTNYIRSSEVINEEVFRDFMLTVNSIIQEAHSVGSHIASCLLVPLTLGLGSAVNAHFQGMIHSRFSLPKIRLPKPAAWQEEDTFVLEIELSNDGNDAAEECELYLQSQEGSGISFDGDTIWFGRIGLHAPITRECSLHNPSDTSVFEIEYRLEWRDRSGPHTQSGVLKIERQKRMNWEQLSAITPYTELSIRDRDKLKGRSEQLRSLHLGFKGKGSFTITGQRRVGKTSLMLVFLAELKDQADVLALYLPSKDWISSAGSGDLGRLGQNLANRVIRAYQAKFGSPAGVAVPKLEDFRGDFSATFSEFIEQFLQAHPLHLAFALDDFDELPAALFTGSPGQDFFLTLRSLVNDGISFFFIGSERLPAIIKEQSQRLNQVRTLKVDYLDREAIAKLVREPVMEMLTFTNEAIAEIELWSARNPYFATLICVAIWERVLATHDYWITENDVRLAVQKQAEEGERRSYEHFWSDSPRAQDQERSLYETKSSSVILSLSKHQSDPLAFAERQNVIRNCEGLQSSEAEEHLNKLIARNIVETHRENSDLVRIRVPLFTAWLKHHGAVELRMSEVDKGRLSLVSSRRNELSAKEVLSVSEGLVYRGQPISSDEVRIWAAQFGDLDDQRLMLKLLHRLRDKGLFSESKFAIALSELHEMAGQVGAKYKFPKSLNKKNQIVNWYVTHADLTGKSGSTVSKQYRSHNRIPEQQCGSPEKVLPAMARLNHQQAILICIDDFIGTGHSAIENLNDRLLPPLNQHIPGWQSRILLIYAAIVGIEEGIELIEEKFGAEITVVAYKHLTTADKAFSEDNDIFATADERIRARDIAHRIGVALEKHHPLGREDSQALIVFPDNVPNNTLPIFYKSGTLANGHVWQPLFPRS